MSADILSRLPHPNDDKAWHERMTASFDELFGTSLKQIAPPKAVEPMDGAL